MIYSRVLTDIAEFMIIKNLFDRLLNLEVYEGYSKDCRYIGLSFVSCKYYYHSSLEDMSTNSYVCH